MLFLDIVLSPLSSAWSKKKNVRLLVGFDLYIKTVCSISWATTTLLVKLKKLLTQSQPMRTWSSCDRSDDFEVEVELAFEFAQEVESVAAVNLFSWVVFPRAGFSIEPWLWRYHPNPQDSLQGHAEKRSWATGLRSSLTGLWIFL